MTSKGAAAKTDKTEIAIILLVWPPLPGELGAEEGRGTLSDKGGWSKIHALVPPMVLNLK